MNIKELNKDNYAECSDLMDKGKSDYLQLCKDYQRRWLESEVRE